MLIVFGFKTFVSRLATLLMRCPLCGADAAHHIVRIRQFFTLFFIPVIPIRTKYRLGCTYCGKARLISKQDAEQLVNSVSQGYQTMPQANQAYYPQSPQPPAIGNPPTQLPPASPPPGY
jgi:hypothetical protein